MDRDELAALDRDELILRLYELEARAADRLTGPARQMCASRRHQEPCLLWVGPRSVVPPRPAREGSTSAALTAGPLVRVARDEASGFAAMVAPVAPSIAFR